MWRFLSILERRRFIKNNVFVGDNFVFGPGGRLWAPSRLSFGNNVSLGSFVRIEVDGVVGDNALIASNVGIIGRNDHDFMAVGTTVRFSNWVGDFPIRQSLKTRIGSDTWLGYGVTVLSGVTIGDSTIIGAGSLVLNDIPPNSIAVGSPAKVIGHRFDKQDYIEHWKLLTQNGVRTSEHLI